MEQRGKTHRQTSQSLLFVFLFYMAVLIAVSTPEAIANSDPVVSNITSSQRTDGSGIVDIDYTLSDDDGDNCTISIEVSDDGGGSWAVAAVSFSGDVGASISSGRRHITWDSKADLPGAYGSNYKLKVTANDAPGLGGMVWVTISDPGFTGQMSKYETTNAQYCQFLNAALASGDITVSSNRVYGANGSNGGADFVGEIYFDTYAADSDSQITYSGGTFSVRSRDGYDMSSHPVVKVSWYGATAFCNYYGFRLPTEWEWQAVADYDGNYTYGCGTTINQSKANYYDNGYANPLGLSSYPYTSPVNHYSSYGYGMNDMAGNVWEWTNSCYYIGCSPYDRVFRGGGWDSFDDYCTVSDRWSGWPDIPSFSMGFRVCR